MWIGWNSRTSKDQLPEQKIGYKKNICPPPTRLDVVAETLQQSQQVAETCQQSYVFVSYNLAIAKLALKT